jgi:tRNA(fMet)-specific endonuclease VapC
MAEKSQQKSANLEAVEIFLKDIQVLPVDDETATIYGHFKAEILEQLGPKEKSKMRRARIEELGIGENDLWIAAVALQHGLTILSADSDFGRMKAVRQFPLETWLSPVSMPPAASGD